MGQAQFTDLTPLIKFYKQPEDGYCHPCCIKMVLDYAIDHLNVKQKKLSLNKIAKASGTHPKGGTVRGNIELINDLLTNSVPRISFKYELAFSFEDILDELQNKRPVIAWINITPDDDEPLLHAVVVSYYDKSTNNVTYIDPLMTKENHTKTVTASVFLDECLGVDGMIIKLVVSTIGQVDLLGKVRPYARRK